MILQTLEAHSQPLTRAMVYDACQRQGWTVKYNSLSPTLSKLAQDGRIIRVRAGWYALPNRQSE